QTAIFPSTNLTVSSGQIVVVIPGPLIAALVSAPVNVQITVSQQIPIFGSTAAPLATSNTAIFVINPPLATLGPNLPPATTNAPYSQKAFTGGTPTFQ